MENYIIHLLCLFGLSAIALYSVVSQRYYYVRYDELIEDIKNLKQKYVITKK